MVEILRFLEGMVEDTYRIRPHLLVAHGGFRGGAAEDHPPLHRKLASVLALLPLKQKSTE